jgi:hypothetical protein
VLPRRLRQRADAGLDEQNVRRRDSHPREPLRFSSNKVA